MPVTLKYALIWITAFIVIINGGMEGNNPTITPDQVPVGTQNVVTLGPDDTARQALDAVGGKDIKIGSATQIACGDAGVALACSYPTKVIIIQSRDAYKNKAYWYPILMHEYAHQIQYEYWYSLQSSKGYASLFNKNIELLADCMAAARIDPYFSLYGYHCTPEQKQYGANAWNGNFN